MDDYGTISNADLVRLHEAKTYGIPLGWKLNKPRQRLRRIVVFLLGVGMLLAILSGCVKNYRKPTAADIVGAVLVAPPAFATHVFWTVYGAFVGVPLSLLEPDATEVPIWWSGHVGPTYISTKFLNPFAEKDHWAYYGHEPEAWFYLEGDKRKKIFSRTFIDELDIDRHTWAPIQDAKRTMNIRGDETKPFRIKGE